MKLLFLLLIIIILPSIFIIYFSAPTNKGKFGEWQISVMLKKFVEKDNGYLINDVIIPDKENLKTSQIDHVLFLNSGIYIVETKNYSGRIYGKENQREWTQVLNYGKTKNKFYNPIMQNSTHIYRLSELIGRKDNLYSCVVFKQGNIKYIDAPVFGYYSLKKFINTQRKNQLINNDELLKYYNIVNQYKLHPVQTVEEHVKEINSIKSDIINNRCPRCGGNLVLRKSSTSEFYGCSNYPKCKFTKNK